MPARVFPAVDGGLALPAVDGSLVYNASLLPLSWRTHASMKGLQGKRPEKTKGKGPQGPKKTS